MGQFLNNKEPYDKYKTVKNGTYFVDKSEILEELIPALQQEQRFFCITRPRRFGKTVMANMIAAFFENTEKEPLFDDLYISKYKYYKEQASRHDVIYIDFSEMPRGCSDYQEYIARIQDGLVHRDLAVVERCEQRGVDAVAAGQAAELARKTYELRILDGEASASDVAAPVLVVSQFTLYGDARKGRRPTWSAAAPAEVAEPLVTAYVEALRVRGATVATGRFRAHMLVESVNVGPRTILIEL